VGVDPGTRDRTAIVVWGGRLKSRISIKSRMGHSEEFDTLYPTSLSNSN